MIWNYWGCMHSVLVRRYKYKYSREGIIPGTWYNDYILDPCSVSLGHFAMDHNTMTVKAIVTRIQEQDGKECDDYYRHHNMDEFWLFTLDEDREITDKERIKYAEQFRMSPSINLIIITRHSTLVIDGTEYNNQYVQDHLNDLRILLDQVRTDTLLEDMDV